MQGARVFSQGDYNRIFSAGGDINIGGESCVSAAYLDEVAEERYPVSEGLKDLMESLRRNHLIILARHAEDDVPDRSTLARHLAARFQECLGPNSEVLECTDLTQMRLLHELRQREKACVWLAEDLRPEDVNQDLTGVHSVAVQRNHFVIVTTETSPADWPNLDSRFWCPAASSRIYPPEQLYALLSSELATRRDQLPALVVRHLPQGRLLPNVSLADAAAQLKDPRRIDHFVGLLLALPEDAPAEKIEEQLSILRGDRRAVRQWFHQLEPDDQILTLALLFFNGTFGDQMFAAVEHLILASWRDRKPGQRFFDYRDLCRVGAYFRVSERTQGTVRLQTTSGHFEALFEAAWELYRRWIVGTLPDLVRLVQEAAEDRPYDIELQPEITKRGTSESTVDERVAAKSRWYRPGREGELWGSPLRSRQFRSAVAIFLGHVGKFSQDAVEASLRELGSSPLQPCQEVAAQALASWRSHGAEREQLLFGLLQDWRRARVRRGLRFTEDQKESLRITVARTLALAALKDPPDKLKEELKNLLSNLFLDAERQERLRATLLYQVIPVAVALHTEQLSSWIGERIGWSPDLWHSVATGYAWAYENRPRDVIILLDLWHRQAISSEGQRRSRLLRLVAWTYGLLELTAQDEHCSVSAVFAKLSTILDGERDTEVRQTVFEAAVLQAEKQDGHADPALHQFLQEAQLEDHPHLVSLFTEWYLYERRTLEGGDEECTIGHRRYRLWVSDEAARPLTRAEQLAAKWLTDDSRPVCQQLAVEFFSSFEQTSVDRAENEARRSAELRQRQPVAVPVAVGSQQQISAPEILRRLSWWGEMALRLVTGPHTNVRSLLTAPFPQFLREGLLPGRKERLLHRWSLHPTLRETSDWLRKATDLYARGWAILLGSGVVTIFLWMLVSAAMGN